MKRMFERTVLLIDNDWDLSLILPRVDPGGLAVGGR